ncbi:MAG: type IV pilus secretin PilQ [Gammaproteobacteria bacterium]|nr:MAG: type IV pilus secretin PilQ [Gammaproteobacteria bacterium]
MNTLKAKYLITRLFKVSLAGFCLLGLGLNNVIARELIGLDYSVLTGNTVQIVFTFDQPPVEPRTFTIDEPARIALDFADTVNSLKQRNFQIGIGNMQSIISAAANGRTRVVLNLSRSTEYKTSIKGHQLTLTLGESEKPVAVVAKTDSTISPSSQTGQNFGIAKSISKIDFKRGKNGEGRILIYMTSNNISTDVWRENNVVNIELIGAQLPDELQRRMDVGDFATPIGYIDTIQDGANIKMTISTNTEFEHLSYQADKIYTIEIAPITKEEEAKIKKKKFGFTGERLSLNFQDIEVRSVLQLLADFTGLNLVVSDSVTGNLTLRLKNVPWDQAMDIILKTKGLAQRRSGNVILIAPTDEIAAREKLELESRKQVEELETLRTVFIKINYAKAAEMANLLNQKDNAILSARGSASVDVRTNTLLVKDTSASLASVRQVLLELDIPIRQVLIESRVVIAQDDFSKELGVRFGIVSNSFKNGNTGATGDGATTAGNLDGIVELANGDPLNVLNGLNVNLPVQNPAGSFALALAKLPLGTLLEMELSAAQVEGRGEVISSPRVITADSHTATISQGVEVPYLELSDGDATLKFRDAVLSLEVTPQITPDDRVIMDLDVHKDNVGETVSFGAGLSAPSIDTRQVQSQLLVDNGQTVVLGGIYETVASNQVTRVPFFSDLPLLGFLFRTTKTQDDRSELLIFVTPKILKDGELDLEI